MSTNGPVFIGVDLGGSTLKAALITHTGEIIQETIFEASQKGSDALFEQIVQTSLTLQDHKKSTGSVSGIGVGMRGLVNRKANRVEAMPKLPSLSETDITTELSQATGLPVIIDNDANAAAYGELQVGAARDRREVFFVPLGTGI